MRFAGWLNSEWLRTVSLAPLVCVVGLAGFAATRIVSLHQVDALLYRRPIFGARIASLIELVLTPVLVGLAATAGRSSRSCATRRSVAKGRMTEPQGARAWLEGRPLSSLATRLQFGCCPPTEKATDATQTLVGYRSWSVLLDARLRALRCPTMPWLFWLYRPASLRRP